MKHVYIASQGKNINWKLVQTHIIAEFKKFENRSEFERWGSMALLT